MLPASVAALTLDTLIDFNELTDLFFLLISFGLIFAVLSVVFYLAGNVVVGREKTRFRDAFAISVLGTLVLTVCLSVFSVEIALMLSLVNWLLLVRHYYETGVLSAIAVGLLSVVVAAVILFLLNMLFGYSELDFSWLPVSS